MSLYYFISETIRGLWLLLTKTFEVLIGMFKRYPVFEKVFIVQIIIMLLLLLLPWKSFDITFDFAITKGAITGDFLYFIIFIITSILPSLVHVFDRIEAKTAKFALICRIISCMFITILYFLTLLDDSRVAKSQEAGFTIYFWLFGLSVLSQWIFGYLGIKSYTPKTNLD